MASATAASSLASASSSFFTGGQQLKAEKNVSRIYGRFNFGGLKKKGKTTAAPKPKPKPKESTRRPTWLPGAKAPEWMDGSLVGDYGFDPLALGKPLEYLQYLDQNLDQNLPGDLLGNFARDPNIKPAIQPYSDVFGLQRFRECELIHGHWAVFGVLGALALEGFTGVYWKDVGKANRSWIKIQRWKQSILAAVHYLHEEQGYGEWLQEMMELYHSHSLDDGESQFMKCSSVVVQRVEAPVSFVWSLVRRFDEPQIYKQFVSSCFIHGEGDLKAVKAGYLREVRVVSGLPAATSTERLDILDEEWHIMSFSIVGGDHRLSNY